MRDTDDTLPDDASVAVARLAEVSELLHVVAAQRDDARNVVDAVAAAYHRADAIAQTAIDAYCKLQDERDRLEVEVATLRNEIQTILATAHTIHERPVASALLLLASSIFHRKR